MTMKIIIISMATIKRRMETFSLQWLKAPICLTLHLQRHRQQGPRLYRLDRQCRPDLLSGCRFWSRVPKPVVMKAAPATATVILAVTTASRPSAGALHRLLDASRIVALLVNPHSFVLLLLPTAVLDLVSPLVPMKNQTTSHHHRLSRKDPLSRQQHLLQQSSLADVRHLTSISKSHQTSR